MSGPDDIYLSVVATSRNDDHGGKIMARMRHCFASLAEQALRFRLPIQLLLVDWNPPADRPILAEVEEFVGSNPFFRFEVVTVPPELHAQLPYSDRIPLFQYYAKNVGLRRALGEFVLATNVDVIAADGLIDYLATRPLRPGRLYRTDRWDTDIGEQLDHLPSEARQEACMRNVVQIQMRQGTIPVPQLAPYLADKPAAALPAMLARFIEAMWGKLASDMPYESKSAHCVACGDFQLMAREDWLRLRGYPELPMHSWHIDSLFAFQTAAAGIVEEMLPSTCPVFHIHHTTGWAGQITMEGGIQVELEAEGDGYRLKVGPREVPLLTWDDVEQFKVAIRFNPAALPNDRGWGHGGAELEVVTRA